MSQANTKLFRFGDPFVFEYIVPEHEQIKKELKPKLESFHRLYAQEKKYRWTNDSDIKTQMCTNYTQASIQKTWYTENHLQKLVWSPLDELLEQLKFKSGRCKLDTFWWNVYQKDAFAPIHNHGPYGVSGVYLLHLNEPNKTVFFHNRRDLLRYEEDLQCYTTRHVKEGTVMLFPSSLNHYVDPAETTRMTISFNIEIK